MAPVPNNDTAILAGVVARMDNLIRNQNNQDQSLRELTQAVNRLSVIEERQTADREAMNRAFTAIGRVDADNKILAGRIEKLEQAQPMNGFTNSIVTKVIGLVLAGVVGANLNGILVKPAPAPVTIQGTSK